MPVSPWARTHNAPIVFMCNECENNSGASKGQFHAQLSDSSIYNQPFAFIWRLDTRFNDMQTSAVAMDKKAI